MSYEVQFQHEGAEYKVIGPDIDGMLKIILGLQDATIVPHVEERRDAAEATLKGLKYEWRGGEQWEPPIQSTPEPVWIAWSGGACPVGRDVLVQVKLRQGLLGIGPGSGFDWAVSGNRGDIVKYRVCE